MDKKKLLAGIEKMIDISGGLWIKGWDSRNGLPVNFMTGKVYHNSNIWALLGMIGIKGDHRFAGFRQGKAISAGVAKGSKGALIWIPRFARERNEKTGKVEDHLAGFFTGNVFNAADFRELDESKVKVSREVEEHKHDRNELIELVIKSICFSNQTHGGGRCAYRPSEDRLIMPDISRFEDVKEYYWAILHETVHATGHGKRIGREAVEHPNFGADPYAEEELIAELGAWFLAAYLGIDAKPNQENAAAYLKGWGKRFKSDPEVMTRSASAAWKATQYILDKARSFGVMIPTDAGREEPNEKAQVA